MSDTISVSVTNDMRLFLTPTEVARGGEHNSATFKIIQQPVALEPLACRAEVQTAEGSTYRLVENGEFALTNDISVTGPGSLQLVYSDGTNVTRKTSIASFTVARSLNAVNESDPTFQDGLAQLQTAAFARVVGGDTSATFYNIGGQPAGVLTYPPGQGGGIDEATADLLYLRLNGARPMQGSVPIEGPNRGVVWGDSGIQGALYSTGSQLVLRLPLNDPPFVIEPNSGASAQRSPVLTEAVADLRYVTPAAAETTYARLAGAQFTGPLITATGNSVTNPGIGIGDNTTGFYRAGASLLLAVSGQLYAQYLGSPPSLMMVVPINMATQQISNVGNPDAAAAGNTMAVPRSYADARYLQLVAGGIVQGPLQVVQAPQLPTDATNKGYVDDAVAAVRSNNRTYLTNTVELLNTTTQILLDQAYPVANNNPRTITVTVFPSFQGGTPSAFYDLIYTCSVAPLIEARSTVYPTAGAYMQSPVRFAATVTPNNNAIQVQVVVRLNATATSALTIVGSGTDRRSYVTIEEQAN